MQESMDLIQGRQLEKMKAINVLSDTAARAFKPSRLKQGPGLPIDHVIHVVDTRIREEDS